MAAVTGPGPAGLAAALAQLREAAATPPQPADSGAFGAVLTRLLGDVSHMQTASQNAIAAFLRGEPVELHQVMAASEEASISLEFLVEIRNKLTDAYRAVMNMQA